MKLFMVRKTLENGVKEYASAGMSFSTKSSKGWGRIGNLKNALWNVIYFRSYLESKENAILRYVDKITEGGRLNVDVLEIDIDNISITETPILEWCNLNMVKEK